jgi:cyclic pyranopterin monophosphate synthase
MTESTTESTSNLNHLTPAGEAHMVDVGEKAASTRIAVAEGYVRMSSETLQQVLAGNAPKGDVMATARIAGIMAAKKTHELIPLCHPLAITSVKVELEPQVTLPGIRVQAQVKVLGQTGVEMEALTAVSVACLTLYDMVKGLQKDLVIEGIQLLSKVGGKSGPYLSGEDTKL